MSNDQRIRQLAHEIWESEGRPEGQSERHWKLACSLAQGQTSGEEADDLTRPLGPYELQEPVTDLPEQS